MFSGTHLTSFEVTMPRLWTPDYYPNGRAHVMLKEDVLLSIIKGKKYVFVNFPFNITIQESQQELLFDAILRDGYLIDHIVTSTYGQTSRQYVFKRV